MRYIVYGLTLIFALLASHVRAQPAAPPALPELLAKDFAVTTLDGRTVPLKTLIQPGKPALIEFWATWCAPCLKTVPALLGLQARYAKQGLQIVALTVDDPVAEAAAVRKAAARHRFNYPVAFASDELFMYAAARSVVAVPKTIVYAADGEVAAFFPTYSVFTKGKIERTVTQEMRRFAGTAD